MGDFGSPKRSLDPSEFDDDNEALSTKLAQQAVGGRSLSVEFDEAGARNQHSGRLPEHGSEIIERMTNQGTVADTLVALDEENAFTVKLLEADR